MSWPSQGREKTNRYSARFKATAVRLSELPEVLVRNVADARDDNAHIESFFHSMKSDVIHGVSLASDRMADAVVRHYLPFYNGR